MGIGENTELHEELPFLKIKTGVLRLYRRIRHNARKTPVAEKSQKCKDLGGVGVGFDTLHGGGDAALLIDEEGGAHDTHAHLAAALLFLPYAVGIDGDAVWIGEENKGKIIFFGKFCVRGRAVTADTDDNGILFTEAAVCGGKGAGLPGAAGVVVLRLEIAHDLMTSESGEGDGVSVLVGQGEIGGGIAGLQHGFIPPYSTSEGAE